MNAASLVADQPQLELERDLVPGALHVGGGYPGWSPRMSYMGCVLEECSIPSSPSSDGAAGPSLHHLSSSFSLLGAYLYDVHIG